MRTDSGFTLVEVIAALGVFAIAAMALINLSNETTASAGHLNKKVLAEIEAHNRMAQVWLASEPPRTGIVTGESELLGTKLEWTETTATLAETGVAQIDVSVTDPQTGQALIRLTALRQVQ